MEVGERGMGVVIIRSNPVDPDPRVEKTADALSSAAHNVRILAWNRRGEALPLEKRGDTTIERIFVPGEFGQGWRNIGSLLVWNIRALLWLILNYKHYDIIHACDFDCIWPAVILKYLLGKKVVYDIFDFYADGLYSSRQNKLISKLIRVLDYWAIARVDAVIIADESRRQQIQGARPKILEVIYNSPSMSAEKQLDIGKKGYVRLLFIGVLYKNRGLKEMIDTVGNMPEVSTLLIGGFGGDEKEIEKYAEDLENVRFLGKQSYDRVLKLTEECDMLFATYDPIVPNHKYSSANKLFEAMLFGKPIIVAKNTGMDQIVQKYGLGFVVDYGQREQLTRCIEEVASWGLEERRDFAIHAQKVYQDYFSWSIMRERLLRLYHKVESDANN